MKDALGSYHKMVQERTTAFEYLEDYNSKVDQINVLKK